MGRSQGKSLATGAPAQGVEAGYARFNTARLLQDSPFSYVCHRCTHCCRRFQIPLTPFDLLRLADYFGMTTTDVIEQHLDDNSSLQRRKDGACKFLSAEGCAAHGGRPLVCRMYPLVRNVTENREWFSVLEPVPDSSAVWGMEGTVAGYLEAQGALPSIEGYNMYSRLHYRIEQRFRQALAGAASTGKAKLQALNLGLSPRSILDPDPSIQEYCNHHDLLVPSTLRHKAACHVMAIEEWADIKLKEMSHEQV